MIVDLPSFPVAAGELLQHVSRVVYRGDPLYFGHDGTNRYDDPGRAYGVLYLGRDLPTALMESVFHKHNWLADAQRSISLKEIKSRIVRAVGVMEDLLLADLTATGAAFVKVVVASPYATCFSSAGTIRSGLSQTSSAKLQSRVGPDHRAGVLALAWA